MYIRKKDKQLFEELDVNLTLPGNWNKFIFDIKKTHNLIIKMSSNEFYCTNCKSIFIKSNLKVSDYYVCPKCKQELIIRNKTLKQCEFKDNLGLLQRYKDYYILRHFEMVTYYNNGKFDTYVCEYGRQIFDNEFSKLYEIINDHIVCNIGGTYIRHGESVLDSNWHYFSSYWKRLGDTLIYYPYNLKSLFNDTKWQYSQLWVLARKEKYFNLEYLLKFYRSSIELLIKLKLYRLALNPKTFDIAGNFESRFGIDKSYLKYMQKHNIDVQELDVLKYSKIKDIRILKFFSGYNLDDLKPYNIDLRKLKKFTNIEQTNFYEYVDYLNMSRELRYDMKSKKVLYPTNIQNAHDKIQKLYRVNKDKKMNKKIAKIYKQLSVNIYQNKKFIIFPAKSIDSLIDESNQQSNCVQSYAEKYAERKCDIYFMRLVNEKNKSLVTVEVRKNKVVQQRAKMNNRTTKEQQRFLKLWENKILNKV